MIRDIELTNFKCFKDISLRTKPLTVIAGGNAAGKSSIIQSLLLLRQSKPREGNMTTLHVDDDLVNLVSIDQVRYANSNTPEIKITIYDDKLDDEYSVEVADATKADKQPDCIVSDNFRDALESCALFDGNFVYLNANRINPEMEYVKGNVKDSDSRLGSRSGSRTVFRLQEALDSNEAIAIEALDRSGKGSVATNVNAWLSYIMGFNMSLWADGNPTEGRVKLVFSTPSTGRISSLNMAFGNTYILPIVLAVLTAPRDSLIIIENPEAHLHPKAQLRIGELLSIAAQNGVQIIIETHSDHLLNGIRKSAKDNSIESSNVAIFYVEESDGEHVKTEITLNQDGSLNQWPKGFFDEWERAMSDIMS